MWNYNVLFIFYCIAKTPVKTKTIVSLQIGIPEKKQRLYATGCCSTKLGSSSFFTAVVSPNRL